MGDGVLREGGVDTTNGRIDHLELYNLAVLGDVQGVWVCESRIE